MKEKRRAQSEWIQEVVRRYEGGLLRYAWKFIGNIEKAREIVQETFLKLWKVKRETVEGHLAPWLYKVCRNLALDIIKKEKRMSFLEKEEMIVDPSDGADEEMAKKERILSVREMIGTLSGRQQEVLILKLQSDMSYKEISEVTGLSVSNVGYLMHEGIQNLRKKIVQ